ncbi:MAG TPA: TIGR03936 family radical SAM-associated protein [Dehalococcoidia bacterium]|nr:TIGR03936 family radical SAM-associated protein [Dehalococcoidia bacterium]
MQRLRVTFARGDEMKYITHLDQMRFWERALRRGGVPVSYSEGFSPHAQIALAAPLAVGTTSEGELMDVFLEEPLSPRELMERLAPQLPPAMSVRSVEEVGMALPALQADVRFAEYDVDFPADACGDAEDAVARFLAAASVPWQHMREDEVRQYDIRTLVDDIRVTRPDPATLRLQMRLRNDNTGSGRPDQLAAALGFGVPVRIHRTRLVLAGTSPARDAWRKRGRFAG